MGAKPVGELQEKTGNVPVARGHGNGARAAHRKSLGIREAPAERDPIQHRTNSVRELFEAAFDEVGLNPDSYLVVDPALRRPAEIHTLVGDSSKARTTLGWRPAVSFEDLVREMVRSDLECYSQEQLRAERAGNVSTG